MHECAPIFSEKIDDCWLKLLNQCATYDQELLEYEEDAISNIHTKIEKLAVNEVLILPGGWRGSNGHDMLYLLQRDQDEYYTLRIVNSGNGSEYHPQSSDDRKIRSLAAITFHLPKTILFDKEESFGIDRFRKWSSGIDRLMRLRACKKSNQDIIAKQIIYTGILRPWIPYQNDSELIEKKVFITPQRGGTCFMSSIKALLRILMEEQEYKKLALEMKTTIHENALSLWDKNPLLLAAGRQNVALCLLKAEQTFPDYNQTRYKNLLQTPLEHEACREGVREGEELFLTIRPTSLTIMHPPPQNAPNQSPIFLPCFTPYVQTERITGENALTSIQQLQKNFQQNKDLDYASLERHFIEKFALHMELSQEAWKKHDSFIDMYDIFQVYCKNLRKNVTGVSPHELTTLLTLYFALWCMFPNYPITVHPKKAQNFQQHINDLIPPTSLYEKIDEDPFFIIFESDSLVLNRFNTLKQHFSRWKIAGTGIDIFKKFTYFELNFHDPEMDFYNCYRDAMRPLSSLWTQPNQSNQNSALSEQDQIIVLAGPSLLLWNGCPAFYKLRTAHESLLYFTKGLVTQRHFTYSSRNDELYNHWFIDSHAQRIGSRLYTHFVQYGYQTVPPSLDTALSQWNLYTKTSYPECL